MSEHEHPGPDELAALLEPGADTASAAATRRHLADCRSCRLALAAAADGDEAPQTLRPGASMGRYVLLETLGLGGMGIVYAAYDPTLDRRVALKVLLPSVTANEDDAEWLLHEARAMAQLSHPHVVTIYDVGQLGERFYLSMEYVAGRSLDTWLGERHSKAELLGVFAAAGRGLAAAHAAGVAHRDFKPSNVLVGDDGRVCVTDFGLALRFERLTGPASSGLAGTPRYLAPELLEGRDPTPASDVYSFHVALAEALERAAPPGDLGKALREELLHGRDPDPDTRSPDLQAILAAIDRELGLGKRPRQWLPVAVAGAGVVALLAAWGVTRREPCPDPISEVPGIWDDTARRSVREAFAAGPEAFRERMLADVEARLDTYAHGWSEVDAGLCALERTGAPRGVPGLCLDHRRARLRVTVEILAGGGDATVERALAIVDALPPVDACVDAQRAEEAPLSGEAYASALQRTLALVEAWRYDDALEAAKTLVEIAERGGEAAERSRAYLQLGRVQLLAGNLVEAEASTDLAVRYALEAGDGRAQASALTLLIEVTAGLAGRDAEAVALARVVEAALEGVDQPEIYRARLLRALASISGFGGRFADCRAHFETALELMRAIYPDEPRRYLADLDGVVSCAIPAADYVEAEPFAAEAMAIAAEVYGKDHPEYAAALRNLGLAVGYQGRAEGVQYLRQAIAIYQRAGLERSERGLQARNNLGSVLTFQEQPDAAAQEHRRVVELVDDVEIRPQKRVQAYLLLAIDLVRAEHYAEAERTLTEARHRLADLPQPDPFMAAGIDTYSGMVADQSGRTAEAIVHYLAAEATLLDIAEPGDPYPAWLRARAGWLRHELGDREAGLADLELALTRLDGVDDVGSVGEVKSMAGRVLAPTDPSRANTLLTEARAALRRGLPQTHNALDELEAWRPAPDD